MSTEHSALHPRKAALLDRDGIINENAPERGYVLRVEDFRFASGITNFLRALRDRGYDFYVVTNQQAVGKGLLSDEDLEGIHNHMCHELQQHDITINGVYVCPHLEADDCDCRKPEPGMLLQAQLDHEFALHTAIFIGDSLSDAQAGHLAGIRTFLLHPPGGERVDPDGELFSAELVSDLNEILTRLED